jgi:hypothetical protein
VVDVVFSLYGRFPRDRPAWVADSLLTLRELGLKWDTAAVPGKFLFQRRPREATTVVSAGSDPKFADFGEVVASIKAGYWPHVWMQLDVPREEARASRRSVAQNPVLVAIRELPQVDTPARYLGSPFYEVTMSTSVEPLIDVEREEDAEQGMHWFVSQIFLPFFISREALFAKADFDPSGAREVQVRHLERLLIPDFYFMNVLGSPYVTKYGMEPFQNPKINATELQKRWMMRTPEGAVLFRAKVEAGRWNGRDEPSMDFYDWDGRFRIIERIEAKQKPGRA